MKYISLFAGIGGFDYALNKLGHKCVWANEWDKYAAQIYNRNFKHTGSQDSNERTISDSAGGGRDGRGSCTNGIDTRDIRTVSTSEIPDHDLLVGGFPCQAFSIAGKRRGFEDTRGTLFFDVARILKDKKPTYFILENVKGLLSHNNGDTFKTIITTLTELGYDLQWQVLNSKNFGVPQNRERVYIVGHLRGQPRPQVFPITDCSEPAESATCIDTNYWKGPDKHGQRTMIELTQNESDASRVYDSKGIAKTLKGLGGGMGAKTGLYAVPMRWVRTEKGREYRRQAQKQGRDLTPFNDGYRELVDAKEPVIGCITNALQKDALLKQNMRIRRLTPTECERLQGFPDGWTEGISDTQRYKCLGNAVTTNVVYEVAKRL